MRKYKKTFLEWIFFYFLSLGLKVRQVALYSTINQSIDLLCKSVDLFLYDRDPIIKELIVSLDRLMNVIAKTRSSRPEVFLGKGVLKLSSKFTGEHPCQSIILVYFQLYWNHSFAWLFSCEFVVYFQNTFS